MSDVAVLMTCHNRREKTLECLRHLFAATLPVGFDLVVYLVDDGCHDGTSDAVFEEFPSVIILKGNGSLYWAGGMRKAWVEAAKVGYDYYLWLNDDTLINSNAIAALVAVCGQASSLVISCGTTVDPLNTSRLTYGGYDSNWKLITPTDEAVECAFFNGNCVMVTRSVYDLLGNIEKRYTHSLGDFDYGIRALKKRIKLLVAPGIHGVCESHDRMPKWCIHEGSARERLKFLYSPLGCNPFEFFLYSRRQKGLLKATSNFVTLHLRAAFPYLWRRKEYGM